jgi:uncharacterized protein YciI
MPSPAEQKIAELTKGMLRRKLYAVFSSGKGLDLRPYLAAHLEYMIVLERQGKLFASGPFGNGTSGDGLTVLRAADEAEAREIMAKDPFIIHGVRTFTIKEWTLMEGSVGLTVNFSDQSVTIA